MGDLPVSSLMKIKSYTGKYEVFSHSGSIEAVFNSQESIHLIVDQNIVKLYPEVKTLTEKYNTVLIEATERNKSFDRMSDYIDKLLAFGIKKNHRIVAFGGGITQDITCFIATNLFRGIKWDFFPTTLLAQVDSCIGSKSSINYGKYKNLIGNFYPPKRIFINLNFLETLSPDEIKSGIGEMIKVHAIAGVEHLQDLLNSYDQLTDKSVMQKFMKQSLEFKKVLIELDEFDVAERNVMNYGHSFGHAIESATDFGIPHGIAVTIGMDVSNFVAFQKGHVSKDFFENTHRLLLKNIGKYNSYKIPFEPFWSALALDKKNLSNQLGVILFSREQRVERQYFERSDDFKKICENYFAQYSNSLQP